MGWTTQQWRKQSRQRGWPIPAKEVRAPRLAGERRFIPLVRLYMKETRVRRAAQNLRLAYGIWNVEFIEFPQTDGIDMRAHSARSSLNL